MVVAYLGSSSAVSALSTSSFSALQPIAFAHDQNLSAEVPAFETTPPQQRWMTLSDVPHPHFAAVSNFAEYEAVSRTVTTQDEHSIGSGSTSRSALTAAAGIATAIGTQGCLYSQDEQTGETSISTGGWVALGLGVPVLLFIAVVAGVRGREHLIVRRMESDRRKVAESIERDLQRWPGYDSQVQRNAVSEWLSASRTNGRDVVRALERVVDLPNTDYTAIAKYLSMNINSKHDVVCLSLPHFLSHLDYKTKRFVAFTSFKHESLSSRLLCMDVLKSMSPEEQDRWINERKSAALLRYVKLRLPEAYGRFKDSLLAQSVTEVDARTAAMIPEVLNLGLMHPHRGMYGGPERFTRALQERLRGEVLTLEEIYRAEPSILVSSLKRDFILREHVKSIVDIVGHTPPYAYADRDMRKDMVNAARLMLLMAVEPNPTVDSEARSLASFRYNALDALFEILAYIDSKGRDEFMETERTLLSRLTVNEMDSPEYIVAIRRIESLLQ